MWKLKEKLNDEVKNSNLRRTKMYSSKIGRNAPCPCGSGKKYKRCCWSKDSDNAQVFEPRDANQIIVTHLMGLTVKYPASITLEDGNTILGRKELRIPVAQESEFSNHGNVNELEKMLGHWDNGLKEYEAVNFLSQFKADKINIIIDGKEYSCSTLSQQEFKGVLFDMNDNPIKNYVSAKTTGESTFDCNANLGLEIAFVKKDTDKGVVLSELLNVIPNSLSMFSAAFLLDAVNFFLSDSLQKNYEFLEKNNFSPDEKIDSSLKAIAKYYYKSKNNRDPEKKECERFAGETLDNKEHYGKLWWKTWEVQLDLLMDKGNIANGQRDIIINEWLAKLVLPMDYGKEENDIRFEAADNWFWDDFKKNQKSFRQIQEDRIAELPRPIRKIMNNSKTSYIFAYNGDIGVGQHANFTKTERQIVTEVFRNPENFIAYFRNLILTNMTNFNIVPVNYIDDLFWNTAAEFSDKELHQPITFILPKARIPIFKMVDVDVQKLKDVLFEEGFIGLKQMLTLTIAPKGIFSQAGIHNPKLDGNIDDFLSFYYDKYPAMINKFEEIHRIYGSNPILDLSENSFRFYFGNKFASENAQFIKSHLEILEEYREQILTRVS